MRLNDYLEIEKREERKIGKEEGIEIGVYNNYTTLIKYIDVDTALKEVSSQYRMTPEKVRDIVEKMAEEKGQPLSQWIAEYWKGTRKDAMILLVPFYFCNNIEGA